LYETTNKFKGCGCVTRQRKVKARGYRKSGELKEVSVTLYGWRVWIPDFILTKQDNPNRKLRVADVSFM
jgi:hypothetical protein